MQNTAGKLKDWVAFNAHAPNVGADFFGFKASIGDVNRFAARYRAANCFEEIKLKGFSSSTQEGYGALCRLMLVYSAFEAFLAVTGNQSKDLSKPLSDFGAEEVLTRIRKKDTGDIFYRFIYERVNPTHQKELDLYFNADPCNIAYMAAAIRHIFAHGWLSPGAGGSQSSIATDICHILSNFLLKFMDHSFSESIRIGMDSIYGPIE